MTTQEIVYPVESVVFIYAKILFIGYPTYHVWHQYVERYANIIDLDR